MTSHDTTSDVRLSNWTLATGTKPGERHVYPPVVQSTSRHSAADASS
jgi:hypothetical protein